MKQAVAFAALTQKGVRTIFCRKASTGRPLRSLQKTVLTPFSFLVVVVVAAAGFRLTCLDNRTMHCDEAGQALKFGRLLENGQYTYDPYEYHGPSLNFLTLPIARLAAAKRLTEIREFHLRLLPAIFGILLVGLVWLVRDELGHVAALSAAAFAAVSPAMVFYSRYYIQEMLLVCFTFGAIVALWRWARETGVASAEPQRPRRRHRLRQAFWLVVLGLCLGMMHATKETCVIPIFAIIVAAASTWFCCGKRLALDPLSLWERVRVRADRPGATGVSPVQPDEHGQDARATQGTKCHVVLLPLVFAGLSVVLVAACVSMLLFSSFFDNPQGIVDSIAAYSHYLRRASGEGSAGPHDHPWYYYLQLLFWWHGPGGPVWSEAPIAVLAVVGLIAAALGKGLGGVQLPAARFLAIYTVLATAIYSAVPYKTPWCALGFFHGMILLAGIGAAVLIGAARSRPLKAGAVLLVAAAIGHLAWQAHRASFAACEDPYNPYVYAHTTADVPRLARRVEQIAAVHPDGEAMHVQVICPDDDHWPLPWYLRRLTRVDWFSQVAPGAAAPLIITQPEMEPALLTKLFEMMPPGQRHLYVPLLPEQENRDWQLRPGVPLRAYVRLDLWERYRAIGAEAGDE